MSKKYLDILIESHATKKPITDIECLRSAIIAEYDAVNMYERFALQCKNHIVKKVFLDIANEEKVHIGEFEELANTLDPNFIVSKNNGKMEINKIENED
jgi:rubrerythrin